MDYVKYENRALEANIPMDDRYSILRSIVTEIDEDTLSMHFHAAVIFLSAVIITIATGFFTYEINAITVGSVNLAWFVLVGAIFAFSNSFYKHKNSREAQIERKEELRVALSSPHFLKVLQKIKHSEDRSDQKLMNKINTLVIYGPLET